MAKILLEVDITEALKRGEMGPGYPGLNEHNWSEEQEKYIIGHALRKLGEDLVHGVTNQPCIDFADYEEMDYPAGMFKSANYDEGVADGSEEDNLMCAQESILSVGLEIAEGLLKAAQEYGVTIYPDKQDCYRCGKPLLPDQPKDGGIHLACAEEMQAQMTKAEEEHPAPENEFEEIEDADIIISYPSICHLCGFPIDMKGAITMADSKKYHTDCYNAVSRQTVTS